MSRRVLFVANRGEVAVRVLRTAAELGFETCAMRAGDDPANRHVQLADHVAVVPGTGVAAYLAVNAIVAAAREHGATHLHPGWGFLSENPDLANACERAGIVFVGPPADVLARFGDKLAARSLAAKAGIPVLPGTATATSLDHAKAFRSSAGANAAVVIKAVAGGGGRGMRIVRPGEDLEAAYHRSQSEAETAFGRRDVYVEGFVEEARHIEVQIAADRAGSVVHLHERDCSIQRRYQKLVEIAPAPALDPSLRDDILEAAVRLASAGAYRNIGTFEFLVTTGGMLGDGPFAFLEANPRLQVEHTVTEELLGVDLVAIQLALADGASLADVGLTAPPPLPPGYAAQARVNAETMATDGQVIPSLGSITGLDLPSGPGIRVDTHARSGYLADTRFDTLLVKIIVRSRSSSFEHAIAKLASAVNELRVEGIETNAALLGALFARPEIAQGRCTTTFVDAHVADLATVARAVPTRATETSTTDDLVAVRSPMTGVVVGIEVLTGAEVTAAAHVLILESMKMEHPVAAGTAGIVRDVLVAPGSAVAAGQAVALIEPADVATERHGEGRALDLDRVRPDLALLFERRRLLTDEARAGAVDRRHETGKRTARENLDDLCDPGSFEEYGGFAFAAQTSRRDEHDLIANTPGDGLVSGIARINGDLFGPDRARCAVLSYDYMVLAGTQGYRNHLKKDRLFDLIERLRLPVVLFAEGGGGRPGDTDAPMIAGLDTTSFAHFGRLSGLVPLVGIVEGRCYAGNAALVGCSDVIIATTDSNIGMGGPAMIEGGGLGVYRPEDIGPIDVQAPNGVVDIVVNDDREAVTVAKRYLAYFQGSLGSHSCADQRELRHLIPENRLRAYDVRRVIYTLADTDSVLELRRQFGIGIVTALARVEGRPLGILANNPSHLGGAIDTPAADKAARFMQLCDAFDLPLLFLCDTPGFMVGPEAERSAQVRHFSRMFVMGASLTVPFFTIVLRKGYGLGAQAMAGGSFRSPLFIVSWPTGEFGGMGLEGAVRLAFRKELEAVSETAARDEMYRHLVALAYERGKALNMAAHLEIDDVIDPAESRRRILNTLAAVPPPTARREKKRRCIDPW